jgi:hypothetical protein
MAVKGLIHLVWKVDSLGYEIVKRGQPVAEEDWVVPLGGEPKLIDVELGKHNIFIDLANSGQRSGCEGVLEFVNTWGLLCDIRIASQRLSEFLDARQNLISAIRGDAQALLRFVSLGRGNSGRGVGFGPLHAAYVLRPGGSKLNLVAVSLLQFCVLEFLHARDGGVNVLPCRACGRILPLHRVGRPKIYCNEACKQRSWRKAHREAINRARREETTHRPTRGARQA